LKTVGIFLGIAVLVVIFVACVIARNRKAEAERKERLKHVFDSYEGAAKPVHVNASKKDAPVSEPLEGEEKIEAIMAAWRASESRKEDQEYFNRKMDKAKEKYLK